MRRYDNFYLIEEYEKLSDGRQMSGKFRVEDFNRGLGTYGTQRGKDDPVKLWNAQNVPKTFDLQSRHVLDCEWRKTSGKAQWSQMNTLQTLPKNLMPTKPFWVAESIAQPRFTPLFLALGELPLTQ